MPRGCTCPKDGSSLCARCQGYAALVQAPAPVVDPLLSKPTGKGLLAAPTYASKLEEKYAVVLEQRKRAGELHAWWYSPLKFRLAHSCYYTPDFLIQYHDGMLEVQEVKGFWRDDAKVKIKVAAEQYQCFTFVAIEYRDGGWKRTLF